MRKQVAKAVITNIAKMKSFLPKKHKKSPIIMKQAPQSQSNLFRKIHKALVVKLGQTSFEEKLTIYWHGRSLSRTYG